MRQSPHFSLIVRHCQLTSNGIVNIMKNETFYEVDENEVEEINEARKYMVQHK